MPISTYSTNPLQPNVDALNDTSIAMTATAQQAVAEQNQPKVTQQPDVDPAKKKLWDEFRQRIDICKMYRRKMIANWTINIDYRRGKPFTSQTDEDQVAVNLDWSLTKAKQAALFSQVPQVRIDHVPDTLPKNAPWAIKLEHILNDRLCEAGIESAMAECLPDCINAAGIAIALVSYEALTEDRQVPSMDMSMLSPEIHAQVLQTGQLNGQPVPMETIPRPMDQRYVIQRISPADFLWPINFTGVNFDMSPWIGRSGRVTWAEAVQRFGLTEADKSSCIGEDRPFIDRLTHDVERDKMLADELVNFDEIFYHEFQYDTEAKSYSTIQHIVYVSGKEIPVIYEAWKGQQINPQDQSVLGAQKYPLRILTLTYLTDEAIPPSDSAIGRPQVNEINKARTQMIRQRERSLPVRTFDVNRLDPAIQQSLMRGTWQAMIPVQGDGARIITEISRAAMPQENFLFDKIAKADWREETTGQPNAQVEETPGDPNQNKLAPNTQAGVERAKVGSFFVGICEVLGGLLCLYEDPASFGEGFDPAVSKILRCSILTDSTVLLDAGQKLERIGQFIDKYAKSGWLSIEPILQEAATLTGLDPTVVIRPPEPKPPVEPNISLRLTGVEDMLNPLALAFLIKSGQAPDEKLIEQAKQLIQQAVVPPQGMQMPGQVQPQGGLPMLPNGPEGGAPPPGLPQGAPLPPPGSAPPPGTPLPQPPPPAIGEAHPQWTSMPSLNKRTESGGRQ